MKQLLLEKTQAKSASVVVIGIGYVGLPLVAEFARAGFRVAGLDSDPNKMGRLNAGESVVYPRRAHRGLGSARGLGTSEGNDRPRRPSSDR